MQKLKPFVVLLFHSLAIVSALLIEEGKNEFNSHYFINLALLFLSILTRYNQQVALGSRGIFADPRLNPGTDIFSDKCSLPLYIVIRL